MNMTAEIIFNIKFAELLNFVNIFRSVQFISNKLCSNGSEMKSKAERLKARTGHGRVGGGGVGS